MILSDLSQAFVTLLTADHLAHLAGGVLLGLLIGILPGLGGIVGLSLLLPFLYGMDPTSALAMLIGLVAVISTSDTFTSVMMGIPGSSASQATVMDGFPLAKQGQAGRALGASSNRAGPASGAAAGRSGSGRMVKMVRLLGGSELPFTPSFVQQRVDLAGKDELAAVVVPHEQGTKADAGALGIGESADNEFLRRFALHLQPML